MKRIDVLLAEKGFAKSRTSASRFIDEGRVTVNGKAVKKPSEQYEDDAEIQVNFPEEMFVSRGGIKLEEAINRFKVNPAGLVCIDIGASTGGFTQCLLNHGAAKVYAVDSGSNQLDESLRNDSRVVCRENVNARYISPCDFADTIEMAVMDVSFISQTLIYKAAGGLLKPGSVMITLIKPQFELEKSLLSKNGIVRDKDGRLFERIKEKITVSAAENGFEIKGIIPSPITGGDGNNEYLGLFIKQ